MSSQTQPHPSSTQTSVSDRFRPIRYKKISFSSLTFFFASLRKLVGKADKSGFPPTNHAERSKRPQFFFSLPNGTFSPAALQHRREWFPAKYKAIRRVFLGRHGTAYKFSPRSVKLVEKRRKRPSFPTDGTEPSKRPTFFSSPSPFFFT